MRRKRLATTALLLLLAGCFSDHVPSAPVVDMLDCVVPADALRRGDRLVFLRDFSFLPDTLIVERGQTVTWVNCERGATEAHTSTADGGEWASQLLRRGESFSAALTSTGEFGYYCTPHPGMRGHVRVR
jgi:hypothetical protein